MKKLLLKLGIGVVFLATGICSFAQTTFNYTGSIQSYTIPTNGNYKLEAWGAQGGSVNSDQGGSGGYAVGEKYLTAGTVLYLYVGGQGSSSAATGWDIINGGYNGGGGIRRYSNRAASGGGASDISTVGGSCTVDGFFRTVRTAASYNARIIVGGGGGGFARATTITGHGGGLNGDGAASRSNGILQLAQTNVLTGGFGTQTSGGNAELYPSPDHATYAANSAPGSFGLGGTYYSANSGNTAAGGGGAGYYGGGVNCHGNGGGGSSYIAGLTNASTTTGIRTGNGEIVITKLCDDLTVTGTPGAGVCPGTMITLSATSVNGGTVTWDNGISNGVAFAATTSMTYTATSTNTDDCITPISIVVLPTTSSSQTLVECAGFSITVGTNTYTSTGIYTDILTAANGCDSTVTTDLTVGAAISSSQTLVECVGFSITVGTNTYTSTGVYTDVLTAANGCDSTVTTDLTVGAAISSSQTLVECAGFSITVGTNTYTSTGVYTDVLTAANGCDSTVTTDLTVGTAISSSQTLVECAGFSITVGTSTYNSTGVYTDALTAANGCDSTVTTDLTVGAAISSSQTLVECNGYSITVGTSTYNSTGVYTDVLTAANGCDSTVTTDLTVTIVDTATTTSSNTVTSSESGATYQWLDCNNNNDSIIGETNQSFTATVNGDYAVMVTVGNCTDTSACVNISTVDINENSTLNNVNVYPNPTNGLVHINLDNNNEAINYTISTIEGRIVNQEANVTTNFMTVDLSNESKGIYLLRIENNTSSKVYKVIRK